MYSYEPAISIIHTGLAFLESIGFQALSHEIHRTPMLGDYLVVTYENSNSSRSVEFAYSSKSSERSASVTLFICNVEGDRFSLEDWLKLRQKDTHISFVSEATEDVFLATFCESIEPVLKGPLLDTLIGVNWNKVDFDWKGYK